MAAAISSCWGTLSVPKTPRAGSRRRGGRTARTRGVNKLVAAPLVRQCRRSNDMRTPGRMVPRSQYSLSPAATMPASSADRAVRSSLRNGDGVFKQIRLFFLQQHEYGLRGQVDGFDVRPKT